MKSFMILLLLCSSAQASLLDRIKLEDTLKIRIEDCIRLTDPNARVGIKVEYKAFSGNLPGTQIEVAQDFSPGAIDQIDITSIAVDVYSSLKEMSNNTKDLVYSAVPLSKSKIKINFHHIAEVAPPIDRIDSRSLRDIVQQSLSTLALKMFWALGIALLGLFSCLFILDKRREKAMKEQVQALGRAFENSNFAGPSVPATSVQATQQPSTSAHYGDRDGASYLGKLSNHSLSELFGDCYWTEQDAYAHWLWKNIQPTQQAELFATVSFMNTYSTLFVNATPMQQSFHDHPYYLKPNRLAQISQSDLVVEVKANLNRWHSLSPLRQQYLNLDLMTKVNAIQTKPNLETWAPEKSSTARKLQSVSRWGEISDRDEVALFADPGLIPEPLKANISSLVWLAQKDSATITNTLERFDARALAEAWIGPQEVLEKLELQMPEKKRKLLQIYRGKTQPTRSSPIYLALVSEGLKNEAA